MIDARTIFLISPANCLGKRAQLLLEGKGNRELSSALHSPKGVSIGEAFSFISSLYFHGKISYACAFARTTTDVLVIAPSIGLVPVDHSITAATLRDMADIPVDPADERYRRPLLSALAAVSESVNASSRFVLLGSVATDKYIGLLAPMLKTRLLMPRAFAGLGSMSRGSLLLAAVRRGEELEYVTITP